MQKPKLFILNTSILVKIRLYNSKVMFKSKKVDENVIIRINKSI